MHNEKLTEAYHAVYDVKDTIPSGHPGFYEAYEAIQKIAKLMDTLGLAPPRRFDGEGRYAPMMTTKDP